VVIAFPDPRIPAILATFESQDSWPFNFTNPAVMVLQKMAKIALFSVLADKIILAIPASRGLLQPVYELSLVRLL